MGTYFTDGKTTISVTLHEWDDTTRQYTPDWSADFYDVGGLLEVSEIDNEPVYACDSIDALIGQANDAVAGVGDYDTPSPNLVVDVAPVASPSRRREQVMTMAPRTPSGMTVPCWSPRSSARWPPPTRPACEPSWACRSAARLTDDTMDSM
mgnify:CR=1 FL=1